MRDKAVWAWRLAVLAVLAWNGYQLRLIERTMPPGIDYVMEDRMRRMDLEVTDIRKSLTAIEQNTRR